MDYHLLILDVRHGSTKNLQSQDTAEYGLGVALGSQQRRERLVADVRELLEEVCNAELRKGCWMLDGKMVVKINET